jgi:magnesium transporter
VPISHPIAADSLQLTAANLHDSLAPFVRPAPVTLTAGQTIGDAHSAVRGVVSSRDIHDFYVLDEHDRLAGVVSIRQLLAAKPEDHVGHVMSHEVVAIPSWATVLIASEYFATRKRKAFPVIHDDGTLAGDVDIGLFTSQVLDVARQNYDDIFQLLGIHATAMRTPWTSYVDRFPWLLSNIAAGLFCAFIAAQFEGLLREVVVLALFIPIVLALAESVSMQSVTLTLQSLSDDSVKPRRIMAALWKEARTGLLLGVSAAAIVAAVVFAWRRDATGALVVGGAITGSILMACVFGVFLPTLVRAFKVDPRIAAGPLVLATTDIVTLGSYLALGTMVGKW